MKTMILVWGSSKRGKSQSIKRLAMSFPFDSIIKPWNGDDYDSFVIGMVKGKEGKENIVGIENQGDPKSNQEKWIQECIDAKCDVIVAACRSYGNTKDTACRLGKDNNYYVVEATTLFHKKGPLLPNGIDLRDAFAETMIQLIMRFL